MAKGFSKREVVSFGWQTAIANLSFFLLVVLVMFGVWLFGQLFGAVNMFVKLPGLLYWLIYLVFVVLSIVLQMGLVKISLRFSKNEKAELADLFSSFPFILKYIAASILYGLIVMAGIILLIIPGIIWSIKFSFYSYFILDKGMGPIKALKESSRITKGHKWNLFLLPFVELGAFLVGAFMSSRLAIAAAYQKLLTQAEQETTIPTEPNPPGPPSFPPSV